MGRTFIEPLQGPCIYYCAQCDANPISTKRDKESSAFHGRFGKAMLLRSAANVDEGVLEDRSLMTGQCEEQGPHSVSQCFIQRLLFRFSSPFAGLHLVSDLYCKRCHSYLGWRYSWTAEESQQYKVGKVILERNRLTKHQWDK
jgi:protein yippee-like 5